MLVSNFHREMSMVMPRSLSAFSLSSTQAYLKEPLPIWGGMRSEECIGGEQPDLSWGIQLLLQDLTACPASTLCHQTQPGADCHPLPLPLLEPTPRVGAYLSCLLLKLLNGPLVNPPMLVDEVPGGGGLAGVHMANDHDIDVCLLFAHCGGCFLQSLLPGRGGWGEGEVRRSWQAAASHYSSPPGLSQHPLPMSWLSSELGTRWHQLKSRGLARLAPWQGS